MNAAHLLQLWETGISQPEECGYLLHRAANDGTDQGTLMDASPGQRSHALLVWRERVFGATMPCIADCPQCGDRMEFELQRADLFSITAYELPEHIEVDAPPFSVRVRPISLKDIVGANGDAEDLFARCIVEARKKKKVVSARDLPVAVRDQIEARILEVDPLLDLRLELNCPGCEHAWSAPFDVAAYCWGEVERWAQRMLVSIHQLARAYGWTERDVLDLSARRREHYLQLIAS